MELNQEQTEAIQYADSILRCLDSSMNERVEAARDLCDAFGIEFEIYVEE